MNRPILIVSFFLAACSGSTVPEPPQDLIPSEKMVPLIVDLQVLESYYKVTYAQPRVYKEALDSSGELLFKDHGVTKDQFHRSFSYYATDVKVIYAIYEAALDSINFRVNQPFLVH